MSLHIVYEYNVTLPNDAALLLEALFPEHQRLIIKQEFGGNLSGSRVFLAQPVTTRGAALPCVVKFAARSLIEKEQRAFQATRAMLYGMIDIQNCALLPDMEQGAVCYPLAGGGAFPTLTLHEYYQQHSATELQRAIERLDKMLQTIHNQSTARPDFDWQASYDPILPPNVLLSQAEPPSGAELHTLDATMEAFPPLAPGAWVQVCNFCVTKFDARKHTLTLNRPASEAHPLRSHLVRIRLDGQAKPHYSEREIILRLVGQVQETRQTQWEKIVHTTLGMLPADRLTLEDGAFLPNPFYGLEHTLNQYAPARIALIHGDLNLRNILIDTESGALQLIDIAEAREDHVLHDFFRLETEIVTHLLSEILQTHALPTGATLNALYRRLHCAAFDAKPQLPLETPHPALEKVFVMLCTLRRAARHHFYANTPGEYYQGLLLYLLGALKFNNLNTASKQAAFWGAAAVKQLLMVADNCEKLSTTPYREQPPAAVLLDFKPEVWIRRKGERQLQDAAYGLPLYEADAINTGRDAQALVHCQRGAFIEIPPESNYMLDCSHPPAERIRAWLHHSYPDPVFPIIAACARMPALAETQLPLLLSPRNTYSATLTPTFVWLPVAPAEAYRLTLRGPQGQTWRCETAQTLLPYPADVFPLKPGNSYTLVVQTLGAQQNPECTRLVILNAEEIQALDAARSEIQALPITETARTYLLAQLYQRYQLWDDAIVQLVAFTRISAPLAPTIWLELGQLYARIGLYAQAAQCYHTALEQGRRQRDVAIPSLVHFGLAWLAARQGQVAPARAHLAATAGVYPALSAALLRRFDAQFGAPPLYIGPRTLTDYACFLAETLAPQWIDELRKIPELFLDRLKALATLAPKNNLQFAQLRLGESSFAAQEYLALAYLVSSALDIDLLRTADKSQLTVACQRLAAQLGLPEARAVECAERCAEQLIRDRATLIAIRSAQP